MHRKIELALVALVAAPALLVAGENPRFTFGDGQIGFVATVTPGEVRCIGGEPTGGMPQCTEGTQRIFGRSEQQTWWPVSLSPSVAEALTGPITFTVNCNFNAQYRGPCWGTFVWEPEVGGTWEGQWTSPVMDLLTYESEISMVGFGQGGEIDGKQLKVDGYSNPGDWYITVNVRIK